MTIDEPASASIYKRLVWVLASLLLVGACGTVDRQTPEEDQIPGVEWTHVGGFTSWKQLDIEGATCIVVRRGSDGIAISCFSNPK